jgi:hypothetical protein
MNMDAQMQQDAGAEILLEPSNIAAPDAPASAADSARSEENILKWMSYLPSICVNTMIKMGWDKTT